MLFNSVEFFLFFIFVFSLYWKLHDKFRNIFLIIVSYIFYGWWDTRFLALIFFSSIIDFFAAQKIAQSEIIFWRKFWLGISIAFNIGILGFFKYFNFFVSSFQDILMSVGFSDISVWTLNIILPVGISFYTFQTMSYTIDVYRRNVPPTKDWQQFFAFVSFFPQLVAGPIERASTFLIQFKQKKVFCITEAEDGARQILWGLFKKIVIADNLAQVVNNIYGSYTDFSGSHLLLATFLFAWQIYCDFSGYSDIAIGLAKFFGFHLRRNFAYPYFSRNISEFWRRWHISLSTWFRDYVFIPLGGSRVTSKLNYVRNIIIVFVISGLWHGANWTFVVWGFLHGVYYLPYIFLNIGKTKENKINNKLPPGLHEIPKIIVTFLFVLLAWVFFRAASLGQAFIILKKIILDLPNFNIGLPWSTTFAKRIIIIFILILAEWRQRDKLHALQIEKVPLKLRWAVYYILILAILVFGNFGYNPFIYFKF